MAELEKSYWWHAGRKSIISQQMRKLGLSKNAKILNVGCGTGGMIPLFEQYGDVVNIDVSDEALKYCKQLGFRNLKKYNGTTVPFKDSSYDLVVATDVLEHIEDDQAALKEWRRVLKPGGHMLITVPAYQWLWSDHDQELHHHRRYTASGLHRKTNEESLRVRKKTYAITFSFPLIVGYRLIDSILPNRKKKANTSYVLLPRPINSLFTNLLRLEAQCLRVINFPFGTSILLIAEK